jgi:hypothetical protein
MSRQKIIDILALLLIVIFMVAIFLLPSLKQASLRLLCMPEASIVKAAPCTYGFLFLYLIPFASVSWLIIRVFTKITKFASLVQPDSQLCRGIGTLYRKIRFLDG